jgi:uncharacterized integral membrane protein
VDKGGLMLKKFLKTVMTLAVVVVGVTFAAKNPQAVSISYYFDLAWEGPLVIALVVALVAGVVLGGVPSLLRIFQLKRKLNALRSAGSVGAQSTSAPDAPKKFRVDR